MDDEIDDIVIPSLFKYKDYELKAVTGLVPMKNSAEKKTRMLKRNYSRLSKKLRRPWGTG